MRYRYNVLGFLFIASVITYVDRVCISVGGPSIQKDLALTLEQWGWVMSAFVLSYGLFEIPAGAMGDRVGPRKTLARIVAWWSVFTALTGAVQGLKQLILVRFLFGMGEAGAFPNFTASIARWFPKRERARAQSVVWMGSRIGGALAPLVVIPLQEHFGWRNTFYIFGAIGVLWAIAWYLWFRDTPSEKKGITPQEVAEIDSEVASHSHASTPWRQIFSEANMWWVMLMYHANAWCGFFYLTWMPIFLVNGRGFTKNELIMFSWLPFLFGALANLIGGFTSDFLARQMGLKWGRRIQGLGGLALATVCLTMVVFTQDKFMTILFLALAYGFSDFALPVAWAVCLDIGQQNAGVVSGAMNMAAQVGSFFTTFLFAYIIRWSGGSYDAPLVVIAALSLVATVAWLGIDASRPLVKERSAA